MKIVGKNVSGIKSAVGYVRECDNWYIELDMSDWSVDGHQMLSANDCLCAELPCIILRAGRNSHINGGGYPTMADVKADVAMVIGTLTKAREMFERGVHHICYGSAEEEGWEEFLRTELSANGLI